MPRKASKSETREVEVYTHGDKKRANNPPAGLVTPDSDPGEEATRYEYDPTLSPQLTWAGKAEHTSFEVPVVSLHVHERIEPSTILRAVRKKGATVSTTLAFFDNAEQNLSPAKALEFYKHPQGWANRLIAGDSLLVMNSLLEKEAMTGKVQLVYFDPPYGIKFGSNFQPFVGRRDVTDGKDDDVTAEPEMVKAFRDTWELGIHSYCSYLRDRLSLARTLLARSGTCVVQISEDNLHHVREIMDEIFGSKNHISTLVFRKTGGATSKFVGCVQDYLVAYAVDKDALKFRKLYVPREFDDRAQADYEWVAVPNKPFRLLTAEERGDTSKLPAGARLFQAIILTSQTGGESTQYPVTFQGQTFTQTGSRGWSTSKEGMERLRKANRLVVKGNTLRYVRYWTDFPYQELNSLWDDTAVAGSRGDARIYVVQTNTKVVERCLHMFTEPGDLVLDITCGSGTTAVVAERLGRRWVTCDTSRVAVALAKQRLMTSAYDYYRLAHPEEGVSHGFVYSQVPHVRLRDLANDEKSEQEDLLDRPEIEDGKVRLTGPFTVEAVPAPTVVPLAGNGHLAESDAALARSGATRREGDWRDELLRAGIRGLKGQQLRFARLEPFSGGSLVHAVGESVDGKEVAVSFGPEFHPLPPNQVELALKEARKLDPKPELLVFAAFEFDPVAAETIDAMNPKVAGMTLARAKMNSDLLTGELKKKRSSNESFFFIGQPDVALKQHKDGAHKGKWTVEVKGYDYFDVVKGELVSGDSRKIAMWMLDTDYDDRSIYPHQVFFPMRDDNRDWTRLAKNLRAEINEELIEKYAGTVSIPFELGKNQKVAVKIVDDRGIESVKVLAP